MQRHSKAEQQTSHARGVIVVPLTLLAKIDLNRDKLSRAEFIEGCVDALLEQDDLQSGGRAARLRVAHQQGKASKGVCRAEFDEFKKSIKDLLRFCVECLPDDMLESLARRTNEGQERFGQLLDLLEE